MEKIIITGSRGLIGKTIADVMKDRFEVLELDLQLGHDLTDENFVKSWFRKNKAKYLVNLFAITDDIIVNRTQQTLFSISLDSFDKYLRVNLTALFSVCREFARNNKEGSIVNFSSIYGVDSPIPAMYYPNHKHIGYCVSKAGVIMLTKYLAVYLAPTIRVNCVIPGGIENNQQEKFKKKYSEHVPLKRMMKVDEINGIIKYLCSDDSTYTTGAVFCIDGGWTVS